MLKLVPEGEKASVFSFAKRVVSVAYNDIKSFVKGFVNHIEGVAVLTLGAFGLNVLLSELPFTFALPMWIELAFVIPVASVQLIVLLMFVSKHRPKFAGV